jgi:NAD(P)-dependent dehydrogenase (short-subunit alcohol dehydrogenase family)
MDEALAGRTAVVTGAAGDIGRACARRLAAAGSTVALADLPSRGDDLAVTAQLCRDAGAPKTLEVPFDVTDATAVTAAVDRVQDELGTPTLLAGCAGYQGVFAPVHDYPAADTARVLEVNVLGTIVVTAAVARMMVSAGVPGAIVNIASMAGVGGAPNMPAYAASKGAVLAFTKAAMRDLAPHGIRVNAVSPAFIGPGEMWDRQVALQAGTPSAYYGDDPGTVEQQMVGQIPLARLGSLDEVADVIAWLLSDASSYVTGENVLVTGGII